MPPPRAILEQLLQVAQRAADPAAATGAAWPRDVGPISILAIGKAATTMLRAARLAASHAQWPAPRDIFLAGPEQLLSEDIRQLAWHSFAVDHPLPTPRNCLAADACEAWLQSRPADHTLIVLLSGGASAQLCAPVAGVTLDDIVTLTNALQRAGATIHELNAVRKHLDRLKGGRMAQRCSAYAIVVLAISDVIGDNPATISSGPFSPDPSTNQDALDVLAKHNLLHASPGATRLLRDSAAGGPEGAGTETPKTDADLSLPVVYRIITSNARVVEAVTAAAANLGIDAFHPTHAVEGQATEVAHDLVGRCLAEAVRRATDQLAKPFCWVLGGEWTVDVGDAPGKGGPSQELALAAALGWIVSQESVNAMMAKMLKAQPITGQFEVLSYSTDGIDGPTDAAGAMIDAAALEGLRARRDSAMRALEAHDSYPVLAQLGAHIKTGPTGTNLNHVVAMLWTPARLRLEGGDKAEDGI